MNAPKEVLLRKWQPADASALSTCLNNMNVLKEMPENIPFPYTSRHARVFIAMTNCCNSMYEKAIEYEGRVVGGISLLSQDELWAKNAELRFFTGEPFWNRGIMSKAVAQIIDSAFRQDEFERIYAYVFEENHTAISVLRKNGFEKEGLLRHAALRNNQLHNVCLLSILKPNKTP